MAEHREARLEELFTRLEGDVASVCSPPGATLAVATARRRRRRSVVAVLAVLALLAVAVAVDVQLRHDAAPLQEAHRRLPAPNRLSAQHLSAATSGWISHLSPGTLLVPQLQHQSLHGLPCFSPEKALVDDPASHTRRFASTSLTVALAVVREVPPADAQRLDTQLVDGLAPCRTLPGERLSYPGAVVDYASQFSGSRDVHVWVARRGDHVGLLVVGGAGHAPAHDTIGRVSDLLVAALADPSAG